MNDPHRYAMTAVQFAPEQVSSFTGMRTKKPDDRYQSAEALREALDPDHLANDNTSAPTRVTPASTTISQRLTVIGELNRRKVLRTAGVCCCPGCSTTSPAGASSGPGSRVRAVRRLWPQRCCC